MFVGEVCEKGSKFLYLQGLSFVLVDVDHWRGSMNNVTFPSLMYHF